MNKTGRSIFVKIVCKSILLFKFGTFLVFVGVIILSVLMFREFNKGQLPIVFLLFVLCVTYIKAFLAYLKVRNTLKIVTDTSIGVFDNYHSLDDYQLLFYRYYLNSDETVQFTLELINKEFVSRGMVNEDERFEDMKEISWGKFYRNNYIILYSNFAIVTYSKLFYPPYIIKLVDISEYTINRFSNSLILKYRTSEKTKELHFHPYNKDKWINVFKNNNIEKMGSGREY